MRAEKIEEEQRRRQTIVAAKVEKETALLQKLRNISRLRCGAGPDAGAIMCTNHGQECSIFIQYLFTTFQTKHAKNLLLKYPLFFTPIIICHLDPSGP